MRLSEGTEKGCYNSPLRMTLLVVSGIIQTTED